MQTLLTLAVRPDVRLRHIKDALKSSGTSTINDTIIAGIKTLSVPYYNKRKEALFVSDIAGLLLFTSSSELMQKAIGQKGTDNDIRNMPGFSRYCRHRVKMRIRSLLFTESQGIFGNIFKTIL